MKSSIKTLATAIAFAIVGGTPVHAAQAGSSNISPAGAVKVFMADPELGVVGSYGDGTDVLYFDVRSGVTKSGASEINARLLDASGRTIAVLGRGMDKTWVDGQSFNADAAEASQKLALPLAANLASKLADPAFNAERMALESLALQTADAEFNDEMLRASSGKGLPARSREAAAEFYARAAGELMLSREKSGDIGGNFRGISLQATQLEFPLERDDAGNSPRVETYSRLAKVGGDMLSGEFGGDLIPSGWGWQQDAAAKKIPTTTTFEDMGTAVMAAQVLAKTAANGPARVQPAIAESFSRLAIGLREAALLPQTEEAGDLRKWNSGVDKRSYAEHHKKELAVIGEHSATRYLHVLHSSSTAYSIVRDYRFCNHGGCPYATMMARYCHAWGAMSSSYVYPPSTTTTIGRDTDTSRHSCRTKYQWNSDGDHNCHDDSWTQRMWATGKGDSASITGNRCDDIWIRAGAPSCS